jgi:hypothetical protein
MQRIQVCSADLLLMPGDVGCFLLCHWTTSLVARRVPAAQP